MPTDWHPLQDLQWQVGSSAAWFVDKPRLHSSFAAALQGSEGDALAGQCPVDQLSAPWRLLLLSDGSVTRHLQLLTGVSVDVVRRLICC